MHVEAKIKKKQRDLNNVKVTTILGIYF